MAPDRRSPPKPPGGQRRQPKTAPGPADPFEIVYFKRHEKDDPARWIPGREFLRSCPAGVRAKFDNVLIAVAAAPPHRYSGGGYWEAMKDEMAGYHEVRVDGPRRHHYRLFCKLDEGAQGRGPLLTVLCGADKEFRTEFPPEVYKNVLKLGAEYLKRNPRSFA